VENNNQTRLIHLLPLVLAPLMGILIWLTPFSVPESAKFTAGIIVWVAGWWLCPLIPLHVTGLIGLLIAHFQGLANWRELLAPYSDPIIFLFMGGFFLARAVEYHHLDQWMVQATLSHRKIKGNTRRLFIALVFLTFFMSAFLSNTATTALVLPIGIEILRHQLDLPKNSTRLLLLLAAAASIGGIMTPVGSPPNMIALGLMEKIIGTRPDFITWVKHMIPLAFAVLMGLLWLYRKDLFSLSSKQGIKTIPVALTLSQKLIGLILIITAFLWALPGLAPIFSDELTLVSQKLFPESVVAILAGVSLMIIPSKNGPLLPWSEAKKIDWATLMLFGSGISLGELAFRSGLASVLGNELGQLSSLSPNMLLTMAIVGTLFLTEIASNTATANLIIPVLLASPLFNYQSEKVIYAVVAAANLAFMLPVGTPPNAIIYATGLINLPTMIKRGFVANLISAVIIIFFSLIIF
jgi:solute carrier family 13 (sodium-dependent dicarboxylate transporter), member 2/3/5